MKQLNEHERAYLRYAYNNDLTRILSAAQIAAYQYWGYIDADVQADWGMRWHLTEVGRIALGMTDSESAQADRDNAFEAKLYTEFQQAIGQETIDNLRQELAAAQTRIKALEAFVSSIAACEAPKWDALTDAVISIQAVEWIAQAQQLIDQPTSYRKRTAREL